MDKKKKPKKFSPSQKNTSAPVNNGITITSTAEEKFKDAHRRLQLSVQEHLKNKDYESSSEEEDLETEPILESVLKGYSQVGGNIEDLEKTQHFLTNTFQSGAAVCLICIATVKRADPVWNCKYCFGYFHLHCIQRWAKDSIALTKLRIEDRPTKDLVILWQCPKCRKDYSPKEIPQKYICFCGQRDDPEFQPWLVPHSCGDICGKSLVPECGHHCLLLCHPGPCPPCPKMVTVPCYCGRGGRRALRCCRKEWACKQVCGRPLSCGQHNCEDQCHPGKCSECPHTQSLPCRCGSAIRPVACGLQSWQCDKVCGSILSCGLHRCEEKCHEPGSCGSCPTVRCCPCGRTSASLPCDQPIPTCNSTCDKPLDCSLHRCPRRCHPGPCGKCLDIVVKKCRCGLHSKELPCQKEYLCDTKCKKMRDCGIHSCNRKCCQECQPCEKRCDKLLSCGQHRCTSICHRGPCYPCNETKTLSCRCGSTVLTVPCCRNRLSPPKCNRLCKLPPECHHLAQAPHRCHMGHCPPCQQRCAKPFPCGHTCRQLCHSAKLVYCQPEFKPATPWEAACMPVEKRSLDCPQCEEPVEVTCCGGHETVTVACCEARISSCGRPCNRPLTCGNHECALPCHLDREECEICERKCEAERTCEHECGLECHPGPCPPCKVLLKMQCHCHLGTVYVPCQEWVSSKPDEHDKLLSCGNQCPRLYSCGHRCIKNCHAGQCDDSKICKKKVKVFCPCKRLRKDVQCSIFTSGSVKLDCDNTCLEVILKKKEEEEKAKEAAKAAEERRNKEELEQYEKKLQGKRRNRRHTAQSTGEPQKNFFSSRLFLITIAVALAASTVAAFSLYS